MKGKTWGNEKSLVESHNKQRDGSKNVYSRSLTDAQRDGMLLFGFYDSACLWMVQCSSQTQTLPLTIYNATEIGLARTVCALRIWPCIWWFPRQKKRIYTVRVYGSGQPWIKISLEGKQAAGDIL